ncbi:MAG TPA: tetratricopeptide repeat protein, partial [bacterium]
WEHIQAAWKWAVADQEHLHTGITTASRGGPHSIAGAGIGIRARRFHHKRFEVTYAASLGNAYESIGQTRRLIYFHKQALHIFRKVQDHLKESRILNNLGIAHAQSGETTKAIRFCQKALSVCRKTKDHNTEANKVINLGLAY